MLHINSQGMVVHAKVLPRRFTMLERGPLIAVSGIIVHQTNSSNEQSVLLVIGKGRMAPIS